MSEHPWLRPLPATLVMMVGGLLLTLLGRDSETGPLIVPSAVLMLVAPGYYLAYALWLVILRRMGRRSPNATPWWLRVLPQVFFFGVVAAIVALSWLALGGTAVLFGMPTDELNAVFAVITDFAVEFMGLSLLVILPLEALYSALGARTKGSRPAVLAEELNA